MRAAVGALKSRRGEAYLYVIVVLIVTLLIFSVILQTVRVYSYAGKSKTLVQTALAESCIQNYSAVYYGMREGNTGAYVPDGSGDFSPAANTDQVRRYLLGDCGFKEDGSALVKPDAGGNTLFGIDNLSVSVTNPSDGSGNYSESATYTLSVPFFIAGNILPDITVHLSVKSGYTAKY